MKNDALQCSSGPIVLGLFGAGGFAREVMHFARKHASILIPPSPESSQQVYFVEINPQREEINGIPLISENDFFELECSQRFFNVAIADSIRRERIVNDCINKGATPLSLQAQNSIVYDTNEIGEGAIICDYSMVTSNSKIGRYFHSNIYSYVAHDCVIGDFVTFAPRVHCNGNVHIHNHAYIGTCAVIKQGTSSQPLTIGEGSVIGMGAIVTKDVLPYTTVVGNPARPLQK
jgi:sugar O-acyltransferase (sialic acid O-acetyltransferase NeuD family)